MESDHLYPLDGGSVDSRASLDTAVVRKENPFIAPAGN